MCGVCTGWGLASDICDGSCGLSVCFKGLLLLIGFVSPSHCLSASLRVSRFMDDLENHGVNVHTVIYLLSVDTVTIRRTTSFDASRACLGKEVRCDGRRYG